MNTYPGTTDDRIISRVRFDELARLRTENARLRETIAKVLEVSYPPSRIHRWLTDALNQTVNENHYDR